MSDTHLSCHHSPDQQFIKVLQSAVNVEVTCRWCAKCDRAIGLPITST